VHEIERHRESLLIVGHQGVLRMILAYFQGVPREEAPHLSLALNHVSKKEKKMKRLKRSTACL